MTPLVIYHNNCTDGFAAAFAVWTALGNDADYLPMDYLKDTDGVDVFRKRTGNVEIAGREIFILDISFPKPVMDWLFGVADSVVWLDHHKTAFEIWRGTYERGMIHKEYMAGGSEIVLDDNRSGAMITWDYFHGDDHRPMLIHHIDDRDRWQFKMIGTKEFHAALRSYEPWSFEQWEELFEDESHYGNMITEGYAILRAHEQHVTSIIRNATLCGVTVKTCFHEDELPGLDVHAGLAANCSVMFSSDVGHELANRSGTFGLCWSLNKDGVTANCSLRSTGDYDVSAIAKKFGGGGHMNSAGFSVPVKELLTWIIRRDQK